MLKVGDVVEVARRTHGFKIFRAVVANVCEYAVELKFEDQEWLSAYYESEVHPVCPLTQMSEIV